MRFSVWRYLFGAGGGVMFGDGDAFLGNRNAVINEKKSSRMRASGASYRSGFQGPSS
jgi:hypothetical protein